MADKVFVDTNVVIDHLTDQHPFANHSSLIFELHEQKQIKIHISALSINTVYYVSHKLLGEQRTLNLIEELIETLEVIGTSKAEIKKALSVGFKDFEDAIQYSTALTIKKVEAIITRNVKDYRKSKIAVFTPEIYIHTKSNKK
ncbi:MAG TPA: PIN domain-containing protein [Pricia sp.]|nr:PIN domain-containing protein [Pricia sp.]